MEGYETFAHIAGTYGIMMICEWVYLYTWEKNKKKVSVGTLTDWLIDWLTPEISELGF
jgi:hypothetical protein